MSKVPSGVTFYVPEGSQAETFLKNAGRAYKYINEDTIVGQNPYIRQSNFAFDASEPEDVEYFVSLGSGNSAVSDIKSVTVDSKVISADAWEYDGYYSLKLKEDYLKTLSNGTHTVGVIFDNGSFSTGATVTILKSSHGSVTDPTIPPEALTTIKYEFYKDYPDVVIIPIAMNGASEITEMKIGTEVVPEDMYQLQDGAIIIKSEYLSKLSVGKYRILPTFNDAANTTISNLQLLVYNKAADRAAPYLLQSRIIFDGSDVKMQFDYGYGDLEAVNVLALVLDDELILPNGDKLPFTSKKVGELQTLAKKNETKSVTANMAKATDSNATPRTADEDDLDNDVELFTMSDDSEIAVYSEDSVFTVDGNNITLNGDYVESLNLSEGDHLIGAIFDNTEKTTDVKKVILTVQSSNETPVKPDDNNNNSSTDDKNNSSNNSGNNTEDNKPNNNNNNSGNNSSNNNSSNNNSGNSNSGSHGSGGSSGGSSGGGSGSSKGNTGNNGPSSGATPLLPDGSLNPNYKPVIPDAGGSFEGSGDTWKYKKTDGTYAKNEWIGSGNEWYHFNAECYMEVDWFFDSQTGKWYMLNRDHDGKFGAALHGWHYEKQDGKWYFLNPVESSMVHGWSFIAGKWYLMAEASEQTYFGDNTNGWVYNKVGRPFGSMYVNEITPDGYYVNANGEWVK